MQPRVVGELCRPSPDGEDPIPSQEPAMCWSCKDGCSLPAGCRFLVALVSRLAVADPTLRNFDGGFLWLPMGLGRRLNPTGTSQSLVWPRLPPARMSLSSPTGLESIKSHLPVPPSRNHPVDHPRTLLVSWSSRAGRECAPHPGLWVMWAMPRSRTGLN